MEPEELAMEASNGCTALYFAAQTEIVTIAEVMVKKNNNLPSIYPEDHIEVSPLYAAINTGNRDMVSYLYSLTPVENLASVDRMRLLFAAIHTDLYDTALKILNTLKLVPEEKKTLEEEQFLWISLEMLARKPSKIGSKSQPSAWERCISHLGMTNYLYTTRKWILLVEAAKVGNVEFLIILIRSYPHLIWKVDEEHGTLFHVAIKNRQEHVFNLIHEIGVLKCILASYHAKGRNNMLHLVGKLPSLNRLNIISGAALQMQRELLWFQEIEKIVPASYLNELNVKEDTDGDTNEKGDTPRDIFVKTHEKLQKDGEKWMKDTANSCMLVAALIATVVFPAAFTVPGGNNPETGIPIFLETNWFTVFLVSDAVAMLFSSSSILVFLSILTTRYTEKDFIKSLPRRLVLGLATLLISIVGMLIAFTAACFLVFQSKTSVLIRIIVAAPAVPISLFVILHYGLWFDIFCSAFCSNGFLFRSQNRLFNSKSAVVVEEFKNDNQAGYNDRTPGNSELGQEKVQSG
ncbi:hypothetical protein I3843_16G025700 [Carya illinoinensis]|uniref:PGG domain-containing protein n=1 Tax=Carya illinoinensis TaxID=32201 RepID=A0A922A4G1_CARIL|nr:hypothetical protein I3842_16G022800 [Carya illinoinensis]KAG7941166.1 hypothetical protein I3843_16G025700 [Carya illinoinensis]